MKKTVIESNIRSRLGIERLNGMQQRVIASAAAQTMLIAPTGSGKTIAFAARMLQSLAAPAQYVQAIVIAPSRELVVQIAEVVRPIATGYKTVALYGGHSMSDEKNSLTPCPEIIVATPGRLLDHIQRGHIDLTGLQTLVLDEYDKTLELGFEHEMKRIASRIGKPRQLTLTSATRLDHLPDYLGFANPEVIETSDTADPRSRMDVVQVESFTRDKLDTLTALLQNIHHDGSTIVFVNHRESAERIYRRLKTENISAGLYHGALDQLQRANALELLANGTTPILVATDLAARGIDISQLANVVHYHLPVTQQAWVHRCGRTARMEASGKIYVITSEADTLPEYITFDRQYQPHPDTSQPIASQVATLYIDAGKKEKISRGDIVGFLIANASLSAAEIGRIALFDHHALVAVPLEKTHLILADIKQQKLKGKKVRFSQLA